MLDAIIIGAGFSGLYQLHSLRDKLNLNCHLFEMGNEITENEVGNGTYWGANIHLLRTEGLAGDNPYRAAKECNECYYAPGKGAGGEPRTDDGQAAGDEVGAS